MAASDLIVGLGHRKRVGKDTYAEMLETALEDRGYGVYKIAFAHEMKRVAQELFGMFGLREAHHYEVNPNHREHPLEKIGKTPRQVWIEFGNAMRGIYHDIWVEQVRDCIETCSLLIPGKPKAFIITDVRYPNEAEAIKSWGGTLVRINRDKAPFSNDVADNALNGFQGWDWVVENNATLHDLHSEAKRFAGILTQKGI